jgi:two-component system phosphate regulon sensor histidine kinase PhoR
VKRSSIRLIIILAAMLIIGLVVTQILWVKKAYEVQEIRLNYDITKALRNVVEEIMLHRNDSTSIYDPVKQLNPKLFKVSINDTLHPYYLESLLKNELAKMEIKLDFEYSIYDCFNDSVVYTNTINEGQILVDTENPSANISWERDAHYFSVYFPNKEKFVLSQMNFWLFSSLLLFAVVIFFVYTIWIILRQKRISDVKNDFINNMTHELKTPISTINISADVLLKPDIHLNPERLKQYTEIIKKENMRLQQQVEKVLQIAGMEREKLQLKKEKVSLNQCITKVVKVFEVLAEEKKGNIVFTPDTENDCVVGDEIHLTNVLSNLIDNALKYVLDKPLVEISTKNSNGNIIISIKDNGIGISEAEQKQIFEKFYRVNTGNIHDVKGFGIGLFYVKEIVEAHQGKLEVNSKLNQGSIFVLQFKNCM